MRGRGQPGAALIVDPPALAPAAFDHLGNFSWYGASYGTPSVTLQKAGFGALPGLSLPAEKDSTALLVLPPADDLIVNGQFETGVPSGWSASSPLVSLSDSGAAHTGSHSAVVRNLLVQGGTVLASSAPSFATPQILGDRNGGLHAIWMGSGPAGQIIYYTHRPQDGEWTSPVVLGAPAAYPQMAASSDGALTVVWFATLPWPGNSLYALFMTQMPEGGSWSAPVQITYAYGLTSNFSGPGPRLSADGLGGLHLAFATDMGVWFMRHLPAATASVPDLVQGAAWAPQMQAGADGQVHFLWQIQGSISRQLYYARLSLDGSLTQEMPPFSSFDNYRLTLNATGDPTVPHAAVVLRDLCQPAPAKGGWSDPVTVKAVSDRTAVTLPDVRFGPMGRCSRPGRNIPATPTRW